MSLEAFNPSQPLTFGVELELQLVSLSDFNLTAASPDLMHLLKRKPFPGNVTPEITESMIEINSSVHTAYAPLLAELTEIRDTLVAASDVLNRRVSASPAAARIRSSTGPTSASRPSRATNTCRSCTATWPSSSRCSASTCTSAAPTATTRCICCMH